MCGVGTCPSFDKMTFLLSAHKLLRWLHCWNGNADLWQQNTFQLQMWQQISTIICITVTYPPISHLITYNKSTMNVNLFSTIFLQSFDITAERHQTYLAFKMHAQGTVHKATQTSYTTQLEQKQYKIITSSPNVKLHNYIESDSTSITGIYLHRFKPYFQACTKW